MPTRSGALAPATRRTRSTSCASFRTSRPTSRSRRACAIPPRCRTTCRPPCAGSRCRSRRPTGGSRSRCRGSRAARRAALLHVQYFVAPRLAIPAVVTVHDLSFTPAARAVPASRSHAARRSGAGSVRRARRVIAVSEFTREDLIDRYGLDPDRVVAIRNGVAARFRPDPEAAAEAARRRYGLERPFVLFVGALQPRKNAPALLEAFARLRGHDDVELVIAGGDRGGLAAVRERVRELALGEPRAPARPRLRGGAPRALLGRRAARVPVAVRGVRAAGARGDGMRNPGLRELDDGPRRGGRRRRADVRSALGGGDRRLRPPPARGRSAARDAARERPRARRALHLARSAEATAAVYREAIG